jgi:hypothetical protein
MPVALVTKPLWSIVNIAAIVRFWMPVAQCRQ